MNVYKKLQDARIQLQNTKLSKSGKNKFAGYEYFELGDFLPSIQAICQKVGLCGVVSFNQDMAYLTIYDTEGGDSNFVTFTSPMSSAALKGCHDVQNLGAVQTYLRRYLWTNAFEIVEHDALDATTGNEPVAKTTVTPVTPKPVVEAKPKVEPKPIVGQKGEFQIVAPGIPDSELDIPQWLANIKDSAKVLLAVAENEEDVMHIFKKNKVLFDAVKTTDAVFFKELMALFTEAKNQLVKE
jgi:ERF superfamily